MLERALKVLHYWYLLALLIQKYKYWLHLLALLATLTTEMLERALQDAAEDPRQAIKMIWENSPDSPLLLFAIMRL
jgi:hypothetical protein